MLSLQWGAWAGAGMASPAVLQRLERIGQGALQPAVGLAALAAVLGALPSAPRSLRPAAPGLSPAFAPRTLAVNPFAWSRFLASLPRAADASVMPALYARLARVAGKAATTPAMPAGAVPDEAAEQRWSAAAVAAAVSSTLQEIVGASVPPDAPLMSSGLDSLGAVELRNALEARLGLQLPGTLICECNGLCQTRPGRLAQLTLRVHARMTWPKPPVAPRRPRRS